MKTIRSFRTLLFRLLLLMAITASSAAAQTTASNEWTWIGGSDTVGQPGIYGTMGTQAATNVPGSRVQATRWTDKNGNLWLLGGWGFDADGNLGDLNDLWKFNLATDEWTWMNGSSVMACGLDTCVGPGSYGTLGTPAPGNAPGGRRSAASWIDRSGNLWLFGGLYLDANTEEEEEFNDLWEFNTATNEWSWMGGSGAPDVNAGYPGIYGTLGIPATSNIPGSRFGASYWTDSSGNFWLFGGFGMDSVGDPSDFGDLNDLWEFNPSTNEWTWLGGSNTIPNSGGQVGVYGTLGMPAAGNIPGSRYNTTCWTDSQGDFWLFGGLGFDSTGYWGDEGSLNDLWKLNPTANEWTWMGGSSVIGPNDEVTGVYGTIGIPDAGNAPGSRFSASAWADTTGQFWLFGGAGYDANGQYGDLNDLWDFNSSTNEWAWMGGSEANSSPGIFGVLGTPAPANVPGARQEASAWTDSNGDLWLFGGGGFTTLSGLLNDLWEYQPSGSLPTTSAPSSFSVPAGTYNLPQTVSISDRTADAIIYFTTDGTAPTTTSKLYIGPIPIGSTETLEAIATATGYSTSFVASATYTINLPPDFSIAASPASMTVTAGANGTSMLAVTPHNGFNSAVTFACSGLPTGASCSFSPATITPSGASASTTLTIATSATTASLRSNRRPLFPTALVAALFCFGFKKRRRLQTLLLLTVSLIGLGLLNGCGGGSSGSTSGGGKSQSVTSTINVTATSGSLQHTAAISLTVN